MMLNKRKVINLRGITDAMGRPAMHQLWIPYSLQPCPVGLQSGDMSRLAICHISEEREKSYPL